MCRFLQYKQKHFLYTDHVLMFFSVDLKITAMILNPSFTAIDPFNVKCGNVNSVQLVELDFVESWMNV